MPRLSILLPDGSEKTIVLPKNGEYFARIGRDEHCEIAIPSPSVSGEHALLQYKDGGYVIEDLGSTNGVKINALYEGDDIILGEVHLKFSEEPVSLPVSETDRENSKEESISPAMQNLQQLADQATRTARKNYMWMALYAVLMFFLALFAGLTCSGWALSRPRTP